MQINIGTIREINRYPIKSFAGESLASCEIESYGVQGDRFATFYDESKEGWWRYITARNIPAMMTYRASYKDGDITVTAPDGRQFSWDEQLLAEIQSQSKTPIAMSNFKDPHPEPQHSQLLSVDGASILLVTDASLRRLEAISGKSVDQRRFRGNFVVTLNEGAPLEGEWIGRQLTIGGVRLQVDSFCERCVMITMDPDTLEKDPSLLKQVHQQFELNFGVYASVIATGRIELGDSVSLDVVQS
ncbi:MOSC domain-containing protein [Paenibacillus sacheonensis]|uniref:MOSC domain-containing protein n=1 Tax=Paenibacillus sacheonensis TaxID=742054 RepID=A0A7X4YMS2_9BACL|nr:uncharacterized protein YcbX [Paenibacillus sacheonensis]NBC68304.1 MOSC domain-containing protein [Paenibacillus sacheonensis]